MYYCLMILSICLIVRDEEATLARCLDCIKDLADELIVVDTGSVDSSVEIARRYTDKVYFFEWINDFSAARNFSFSKATGDFVMWLDADDVITADNVKRLAELKARDDFDVAFVKYAAAFDGDVPTMEYYRERVVRRSLNLQWEGEVHEAIVPVGRVIYSEARIDHRKVKANPPMRNLQIFQQLIASGKTLDERQKFYYGRELFYNGMYLECIAVLKDFLKGGGWIENKIEACRTICRAYQNSGMEEEAVKAIFDAFLLAPPRAEDCCILGEYFERKNCVRSAIYWYQSAILLPEELEGGGFVNHDFSTFIPAIRLCVLFDALGDTERAVYYNELAGKFKPNNASYMYNLEYFKNKLSKG